MTDAITRALRINSPSAAYAENLRQVGAQIITGIIEGLNSPPRVLTAAEQEEWRAQRAREAAHRTQHPLYPDKHPTHDWTPERPADGQAECLNCGACTDCDPHELITAPCQSQPPENPATP